MSAADQIRIEQEKLDQIRRETEKEGQEFIAEMREKLRAQKEAGRDGGLNRDAQREALREAQKRTDDFKDRIQRQQDQEKRERQQKTDQNKTDEQKQSDQRKADQQKKDDQQKEDHRAEARAKTGEETERVVKEELRKHVENRQEKIMAGSVNGPAMTPGTINDPIRMAAAMDHPGLTDDQKLILNNAGYAVGVGWHNREAQRKEELMQAERQKTADLRADFQKREGATTADRDDAVSDAKENSRKDHEDQQVGETGKDKKERADIESNGKFSVKEAEEMTHGEGSKEKEDRKFEEWFSRNKDQELDKQGISQDAKDYEQENER